MRFFVFLSLMFFLTGCKFIDGIAYKIIYPFDKVDEIHQHQGPPENYVETTLDNKYLIWAYDNKSPKTVVYFHGNGESLQALYNTKMLSLLQSFNTNLVFFNYPGQHGSSGKPSKPTIIEAGLLAVQYAIKNFPDTEIILVGRSFGAGAMLQVYPFVMDTVYRIILISPFTSLYDAAISRSNLARGLSKTFKQLHNFDSKRIAESIFVKSLVIHGRLDKIIPYEQGREMAITLRGDFLSVEDKGHNDLFSDRLVFISLQDFIWEP